jgi:hypothetical protein
MVVNGKRHILASFPQERTPIDIKVETWASPRANPHLFGHHKISSDRDLNFGPFNP